MAETGRWGSDGEGATLEDLYRRRPPHVPIAERPADPLEELARGIARALAGAGHRGRAGAVIARRAAVLLEAGDPRWEPSAGPAPVRVHLPGWRE